jgi:hypothetical protein
MKLCEFAPRGSAATKHKLKIIYTCIYYTIFCSENTKDELTSAARGHNVKPIYCSNTQGGEASRILSIVASIFNSNQAKVYASVNKP